jgi:adenylate cyclase
MEAAEETRKSIAVLPFENLSPDPESEYFSEGMTDELIGRLSRIVGVRVVSRTSAARFKETELDVKEIAAELGVNYVLEGGVRKAEDRVRITVQLTEASSGFEEWSDIFNGESEDWFALHEEMAIQIAEALDLHLSPKEAEAVRAHYTENAEAYDAFWRGWVLLESFHSDVSFPGEKLTAAEEHFEHALRLDPQYALAVAGLSMANSYYNHYGVDRTAERRDRAEELARRALALDYDLPEAHVALGQAYGIERNHLAAVDEYREALRLEADNAVVWCLLAYSCNFQDPPDPRAAESAAREAIRIDPTWFLSYHQLGWALQLQGRYEEAVAAFEYGAQLSPAYRANYWGLGRVQLALGNYDEALASLEKAHSLGETGELLVYMGAAHAGLGDVDGALAAVEQGLARGFRDFDAIEGSPYFASLRDDPRFQALLEKYE